MTTFTTIVGLEVHVQLQTRTKIFCGCLNQFNPDNPNVQTCPVCLGLPGSLPVLNREAYRLSVKTALALKCNITPYTKWDRKQYYYPDLPKGYQISQYDLPFSTEGWLEFDVDGEMAGTRRVNLIRVHLEEDAGKNLHDESGRGTESLVDLNRAGTPLLEIVSQPDIRSPHEARRCLEELRLLLTYLEVSDCNMQEGSLRCDANVNLHVHTDDGRNIPTPIVEIKNLNTFRGVEAAIEFEVRRQIDLWEETRNELGEVAKETRGWDADRGITFAQRGKEEASDYRYFPDPDLVPVTITEAEIDALRDELCEFPADRRRRIAAACGLSNYDANVIIDQGRAFADYFENAARGCGDGKLAANWVTQDVLREMKERKLAIEEFPLHADVLAALLKKIADGRITTKSAREVFADLLRELDDQAVRPTIERIDQIIELKGLGIVSDSGELQAAIDDVVSRNAATVADFKAGKQQAVGPLIGQVVREVRGADPKVVRQMLIDRLDSM